MILAETLTLPALELDDPFVLAVWVLRIYLEVDAGVWVIHAGLENLPPGGNILKEAVEEAVVLRHVEVERPGIGVAEATEREQVLNLIFAGANVGNKTLHRADARGLHTRRILRVVVEGQFVVGSGELVDVEMFANSVRLEFPVARTRSHVELSTRLRSERAKDEKPQRQNTIFSHS